MARATRMTRRRRSPPGTRIRLDASPGHATVPLEGDRRRADHGGVAPPPRGDPWRGAEARGSSDCRVRFSRQGEARPDSDLDLLVDFEPVLPSLITSLWSRTLRNSWTVELTWLRDTPSSLGTNAFARRPWI